MLPFTYAIRNLFRDKSRLAQTVGGSALVVLLVIAAAALNGGMKQVLSASGSPNNAILLGAGSEESIQRSEIAERTSGIASTIPGISRTLGQPAISTEIHYMTYLQVPGKSKAQALFRGVTPAALRVHPEVRLLEGTFPRSGQILIGKLAHRKLGLKPEALKPGATALLDGSQVTISGTFAAPGTVMESEIWAPLSDIRMLAQRETVSCVVLRLDDPADFAEADLFSKQRLDLELTALRESDYYSQLAAFFKPLRLMTWVTAGLVAAGALFGGLNTLYAAFASRIRELATLQAIGYTRTALLLSLIQESLLATLIGTLIASAAALLLLDGRTIPFSIGAFTLTVTPAIALLAIATGLLLGILGALPPAIRCLKPALPGALRS